MKEIARHHHDIGFRGDDLVDNRPEGARHIGLPLVEARGSLPMVLSEAEMEIGEVGENHGGNSKGGPGGSKSDP
ncbi:MAG TPA: hypothetical protein VG692_14040, partial [Gemmatimonadales bacterium]|nr:hypothetical protein [Gemmatimonadales bacterium]